MKLAKNSDVVDITAKDTVARKPPAWRRSTPKKAAKIANQDEQEQAARVLDNLEQQYNELPVIQQDLPRGRQASRHIQRLKTVADVGVSGNPDHPGVLPTTRAGNPIETILLGVLFGALLGGGLALVREQSDRKLRRTEQVTAAFDAPVLTTVPRNRALKRHKPFADLPPQIAEAFRMLQMNLRFARDEPVRSVLVTSARTGRGRPRSPGTWPPRRRRATLGRAGGGRSPAPSLADRYDLEQAPGLAEALRGESRSRPRCRRSCRSGQRDPGRASAPAARDRRGPGRPQPVGADAVVGDGPRPRRAAQGSRPRRHRHAPAPPWPTRSLLRRRWRAGHGVGQLRAGRRPAACATSSKASTRTSSVSSRTAVRRSAGTPPTRGRPPPPLPRATATGTRARRSSSAGGRPAAHALSVSIAPWGSRVPARRRLLRTSAGCCLRPATR